MRALTRVHKVKKFTDRPQREDRKTTHIQEELTLVSLTQEQESRPKLRVSLKELPTTREQLETTLGIDTPNTSDQDDEVLIKLQKLRDFFNPLLHENKCHEDSY